jgi:protein TilB
MKLTEILIRKKAEHHDGPLTTLEELTLHQLELDRIEPVLGSVCRKLRILYLQNNIIPKFENLHHMKDLRYLNMGLNNCTKIEGLSSCEFLNKLDVIVNFIDVDELEASIEHLQPLLHLKELFLMGNPCTEWPGHRAFVIALLPQLASLDGTEINKAERIQAQQQLKKLRAELRILAANKREEKGLPVEEYIPIGDDDENEPWTPATRVRMYKEMAEQKEEKEARQRAMEPKERDYEKEQREAVAKIRADECDGVVKQCNEGRWDFVLEDEDGQGNCQLRLGISRFLDTSLADVDVHPSYVSVVVKGKLFRILWPDEVRSEDAVCQRSQASGELVISAPKVKEPTRALLELKRKERADAMARGEGEIRVAVAGHKGGKAAGQRKAAIAAMAADGQGIDGNKRSQTSSNRSYGGKIKVAEEMMEAVKLAGIATGEGSIGGNRDEVVSGTVGDGQGGSSLLRATSTTYVTGGKVGIRGGINKGIKEEPVQPPEYEPIVDDDGDEVPGLE